MDSIKLVTPLKEHEKAAQEYRQEHLDNGEPLLHGGSLLDTLETYDAWLDHLEANSDEKTVQPGWVTSSTFFGVRERDSRIIGMIDVRHTLNDYLRNYGGHIGYGVRPSERRKGYATQMLKLALNFCRNLGLDRVMLACEKDNPASRLTIEKCGGVLEREFQHTDGMTVQVFWITL